MLTYVTLKTACTWMRANHSLCRCGTCLWKTGLGQIQGESVNKQWTCTGCCMERHVTSNKQTLPYLQANAGKSACLRKCINPDILLTVSHACSDLTQASTLTAVEYGHIAVHCNIGWQIHCSIGQAGRQTQTDRQTDRRTDGQTELHSIDPEIAETTYQGSSP